MICGSMSIRLRLHQTFQVATACLFFLTVLAYLEAAIHDQEYLDNFSLKKLIEKYANYNSNYSVSVLNSNLYDISP